MKVKMIAPNGGELVVMAQFVEQYESKGFKKAGAKKSTRKPKAVKEEKSDG